jgi:dinuclear metal center YbgI/SA1388 family protein
MTLIKLQELLDHLAQYLKIEEFKDYCVNGAQVRGKEELRKIAFSTSSSLDVIEESIKCGADAIVVHHGLFWEKDKGEISGSLKEKLKKLLKHDISLICYHLPLDAHKEIGNNYQTLRLFGLEDIHPFEAIGAKAHGVMHVEDLLKLVKQQFHIEPVIPPFSKTSVSSIACVTGGGHSYLKAAKNGGIEAFITGTCDEWVWDYAKENQLLFIPLGHYRSETIGIKSLMNHVQNKFHVECVYLENFNPY